MRSLEFTRFAGYRPAPVQEPRPQITATHTIEVVEAVYAICGRDRIIPRPKATPFKELLYLGIPSKRPAAELQTRNRRTEEAVH